MTRCRLPYLAFLALVWMATSATAAQTELSIKALDLGDRVFEAIRFAYAGIESLTTRTGAGVTGLTVPQLRRRRIGHARH